MHLDGDGSAAPLSMDATAEDFLARADAREWLLQQFDGMGMGEALTDPEHGRMLRAIPRVRLARFPGTGLDETAVRTAIHHFGG
ncbi:hypothetical protein BJF85_18410 [Saccharomonospora sp. CUA-673]|nr:hypothetical protein BJF85_18410 [Saccharomonospora sp. CUA-673]